MKGGPERTAHPLFEKSLSMLLRLSPVMPRHLFARDALGLGFGGLFHDLAQILLCYARHTKMYSRLSARRIPSASRQVLHRPKADTDIAAPSHREKALALMMSQQLASARAVAPALTS